MKRSTAPYGWSTRRNILALAFLGLASLSPLPVHAQLENLRFNFLAPGARSLALGGAFLGLADDATAAYTNPAGLSNLSLGGPEVAVELRGWQYRNSGITDLEGNYFGRPSGIGIDTQTGLHRFNSSSETQGLSFFSIGYVLPHGWTLAAYRHELANFKLDVLSQGLFLLPVEIVNLLRPGDCNPTVGDMKIPCRLGPYRSRASARIENTGLSAAYQLSSPLFARLHDSLTLGVGWVRSEADIQVLNDAYAFAPYTGSREIDRLPGHLFGPADTTPDRLQQRTVFRSTASDQVYTAGFLWQLGKNRRWSLGGAYRKGASFPVDVRTVSGPADPSGRPAGRVTPRKEELFRVPDSYGLGIAYSAAEGRTKIALDYDRVLYAQGFKATLSNFASDQSTYRQKDAGELHLGVEHVFLVVGSLFVATARGGVWYEQAHDFTFAKKSPVTFFPKDQIHWSAGLGLVVKEDFQVDLGADLSEPVRTFSLSLVKFF